MSIRSPDYWGSAYTIFALFGLENTSAMRTVKLNYSGAPNKSVMSNNFRIFTPLFLRHFPALKFFFTVPVVCPIARKVTPFVMYTRRIFADLLFVDIKYSIKVFDFFFWGRAKNSSDAISHTRHLLSSLVHIVLAIWPHKCNGRWHSTCILRDGKIP